MSFVTEAFVRRLSPRQRESLVQHVEGPQPIGEHRTLDVTDSMVSMGLLRKVSRGSVPRRSVLTYAGREASAIVLAALADALVAAGCLDDGLRPLDLARRVKDAAQESKARAFPALIRHRSETAFDA